MSPSNFYSGYNLDYENRVLEIFTKQPDDNETLFTLWADAFADIEHVNLLLSGGIDSQFALSVLLSLGKSVKVYICSFIWEDAVFNGPDVIHAMRYCNRFNLDYTSIEIDYKHFLHTNKHLEICKKYKAVSPQIALQLAMLDLIDNNDPIVMGGDLPLMQFDFEKQRSTIIGLSYQPFIMTPFLNYARYNNRIVIKDLFRLNPKTHYLGYKQCIDTTKKHKMVIPHTMKGIGATQALRKLIYSDIGANILPPLAKNTGFENLKSHLAMHSGIYNQFDMLYRYPLENTLRLEPWYNHSIFKVTTDKIISELRQEYEQFCIGNTELHHLEFYNFIL